MMVNDSLQVHLLILAEDCPDDEMVQAAYALTGSPHISHTHWLLWLFCIGCFALFWWKPAHCNNCVQKSLHILLSLIQSWQVREVWELHCSSCGSVPTKSSSGRVLVVMVEFWCFHWRLQLRLLSLIQRDITVVCGIWQQNTKPCLQKHCWQTRVLTNLDISNLNLSLLGHDAIVCNFIEKQQHCVPHCLKTLKT